MRGDMLQSARTPTSEGIQAMKSLFFAAALAVGLHAAPGMAQPAPARDEFFWLGEMNKATAVINSSEGLLDKALWRASRRAFPRC